jgi:hypothetical protein
MLDLLKEEKETPELPDCKIGVVHGLPALFAHDADADVGSLDHCHVIGTCASGKKVRRGAERRAADANTERFQPLMP